jgi:P-type Cu2+ transporter
MAAMAAQMRNRFFVSLMFTPAILAWSAVGTTVFGSHLATPLGLDRNVWLLLLSLPVLWAARMFFTGAVSALRQRTLDMNVLVAVAIGVSWVYSVAVTGSSSSSRRRRTPRLQPNASRTAPRSGWSWWRSSPARSRS